jgi:hypothetical protein
VNVSFKVFGFEIASLDVDFGEAAPSTVVVTGPVERFTGAVSRAWLKRLF